jgi:N-acetylneuraminate lyase
MVTPIGADDKPALDVLERLTNGFVEEGLDGLYVLGSTGQWPMLTVAERCAVAACVVRAVAGRIPVMIHIGAASTADSIALARHAADVGADAVSAISPIYYDYSADEIFAHYRRIGAATDLPLFVYHLQGVTRLQLDPREYAKRILSLPNIGGMKITNCDLNVLGLMHEYAGDRLSLFSGMDEIMCHAVLCGAAGAIGTFFNVWGPACQRARNRCAQGSIDVAGRFMRVFQRVVSDIIRSQTAWSFLRAAARIRFGLDIGMPRQPLGGVDVAWSAADVETLLREVDAAI